MHWEILIIPLIALVVWIIGTLAKSEDDKSKKGVGRRGNVSGRPPVRRMVTDLDRFLEEARRRREPDERRKTAPPPARVSTERPPVRERPSLPSEPPPRPAPLIAQEEVVVALPAPPSAAALPMAELVVAAPPPREASPSVSPYASNTRPSPIRQQVRSLLGRPQTAATAFVLRELFDRPLCKRRRA